MPAIRPSFSANARSASARSLNGTTRTRSANACGIPIACGTVTGCSRAPISSGSGRHGEHQRVVVAVVRPLDLHDQVPARVRAHQPDGLERRLRPGVAEPPEREPEPLRDVLADLVELRGGLREVRSEARPLLDRFHDLGCACPIDHRAVTEVVVDVLVPVEVPDVAARAPVDEDRVRGRGLPGRRDPAGDVTRGDVPVLDRGAMLRLEGRFFVGDQSIDQVEVELDRLRDCQSDPPSGISI